VERRNPIRLEEYPDSDGYVGLQFRKSSGLGRRLALAFAAKELVANYDEDRRFFEWRCVLGGPRMAPRLLVAS